MIIRHFISLLYGAVVGLAFCTGVDALTARVKARHPRAITPDSGAQDDTAARCQNELREKTANNACLLEFLQSDSETSPGCHSLTCSAIEASEDISEPTTEEWKAFAKQEHVQFYLPCPMREKWSPDERDRAELGISSTDARAIAEVYGASTARGWAAIRPLCAEVLGIELPVADRLGLSHCSELLDSRARDDTLLRRVAEIRAGLRTDTGAERRKPIERYVLARLEESKRFEAELLPRVGSEVTRTVVNAGSFCVEPRAPSYRRYESTSMNDATVRCRNRVLEIEAQAKRLSRRLYRQIGRSVEPHVEYACTARIPSSRDAGAAFDDRTDPMPSRNEWKALAARGTLRFSVPCRLAGGFAPPGDGLLRDGLSKFDGRNLSEAYKSSSARLQKLESVACAEVLSIGADAVARIGNKTCLEVLEEQRPREDPNIFRIVAEIRAGDRAREPATLSPLARYYLALTEEVEHFEADLVRLGGIERARAILQSPLACFDRVVLPPSP